MAYNPYTERDWFRTVGIGKVPDEYKRKTYAVVIEPFPMEGVEYVYEKNSYPVQNPPPVKTFHTKEDAEKEASKWNTGVVVEYSG
tara:strand:+ start:91 stop:345 length:255 start_codon:yes stop_codon:yes gene_type:complete